MEHVTHKPKNGLVSWSVSLASDARAAAPNLIRSRTSVKKLAEQKLQHEATHDA